MSRCNSSGTVIVSPSDSTQMKQIVAELHAAVLLKGMVIAVLASDPNHEYYLQKMTTGPELIEQKFSDSWSGTSDRVSKSHAVSTIVTLLW
jgi:hypothetical protein